MAENKRDSAVESNQLTSFFKGFAEKGAYDLYQTASDVLYPLGSPSNMGKMHAHMKNIMRYNDFYRKVTLDGIGDSAYYGGTVETPQTVSTTPSYIEDNDYSKFANTIPTEEKDGYYSTRYEDSNLYPNDLGVEDLVSEEWWFKNDKNSILNKTKKLFNEGKINTIISRFGTKADAFSNGIEYNGQVKTEYGESHGRNLLTREAECEGKGYDINGYNNPYCRVWTHHYQYDKLQKTMRAKDFDNREWESFKFNGDNDSKWGWKSEKQDGWKYSVLNQETGMVNITPVYDGDGNHIHTKQCMFSIENLAWKGYDPYSFEKALSWEQRGPLGGRIMWFPPYGLRFQETATANWNEETFIGRGEPVYTYTHSKRTGTLSFLMVVDHPSIIDYATWHNSGTTTSNKSTCIDNCLSDNDLHRYFAGCDDGRIKDFVKPTILHNDGYEQNEQADKPKETEGTKNDNEDENENEEKVVFYVFFPNNYSGYYDRTYENRDTNPICYLLGGYGCGFKTIKKDNGVYETENINNLNFDKEFDELYAVGYEMNQTNGITATDSFIIGNKESWQKCEKNNGKKYEYDDRPDRRWYYRIEGEYKYPQTELEGYRNTYGQRLIDVFDYQDCDTYQLNSKIDKIEETKDFHAGGDDSGLYSFTEVVKSLIDSEKMTGVDNTWEQYVGGFIGDREEKVNELVVLFRDYKIEKIDIIGYSNIHGEASPVKKERNEILAKDRADTIKWFLNKQTTLAIDQEKVKIGTKSNVGEKVNKEKDVGGLYAKLWRSVKCEITFKKDRTDVINVQDEFENLTMFQKIMAMASNTGSTASNTQVEQIDTEYSNDEVNKYRYDQEFLFFKALKETDKITYEKLMDKIKYFDPAFHSMTPEGFNGRLNFLHQCTRQGDTISSSDSNNLKSSRNLSFGRPPFCVLRLGDFLNQLVIIDSVQLDYESGEGMSWDLNKEGAGVQPLLVKVILSLRLIGGGDMAGPIRRLQNAMTFNYYSNTSLYDNRADRVVYDETDERCMGGGSHHEPIYGKSYIHKVPFSN